MTVTAYASDGGEQMRAYVGMTFHHTHYRSYRGRVFTSQMAQPTVSKHWRKAYV